MPNFHDTFETNKWSLISSFSICLTVPSESYGHFYYSELAISAFMELVSKQKSTSVTSSALMIKFADPKLFILYIILHKTILQKNSS